MEVTITIYEFKYLKLHSLGYNLMEPPYWKNVLKILYFHFCLLHRNLKGRHFFTEFQKFKKITIFFWKNYQSKFDILISNTTQDSLIFYLRIEYEIWIAQKRKHFDIPLCLLSMECSKHTQTHNTKMYNQNSYHLYTQRTIPTLMISGKQTNNKNIINMF